VCTTVSIYKSNFSLIVTRGQTLLVGRGSPLWSLQRCPDPLAGGEGPVSPLPPQESHPALGPRASTVEVSRSHLQFFWHPRFRFPKTCRPQRCCMDSGILWHVAGSWMRWLVPIRSSVCTDVNFCASTPFYDEFFDTQCCVTVFRQLFLVFPRLTPLPPSSLYVTFQQLDQTFGRRAPAGK